jgi:hypothetical protein
MTEHEIRHEIHKTPVLAKIKVTLSTPDESVWSIDGIEDLRRDIERLVVRFLWKSGAKGGET